jgi:hypothetical protein
MFCAPGHVFDGIEGVGSRFQALRTLDILIAVLIKQSYNRHNEE